MRSIYSITFIALTSLGVQTIRQFAVGETEAEAVDSISRAYGTTISPLACVLVRQQDRPARGDCRFQEARDLLSEQLYLRGRDPLPDDLIPLLKDRLQFGRFLDELQQRHRIDVEPARELLSQAFAWRSP